LPPAAVDDDFSTRPTAERPAFENGANEAVTAQPALRKPRYVVILIIALISLLLLSAIFVYSIYLKPKPPPPAEQQPE
jgi:hypothetical protein